MRSVIYLPFLLSAVLIGLSAVVCRRTAPRRAAWSVAAAMVVMAGAALGALGLLAWPLVARVRLIAQLGGWHPAAVDQGVPVPMVVSAFSLVALAAVGGRVVRLLIQLRAELMEISRFHDGLALSTATVVVIDDPVPTAHALSGTPTRRGRVIVSTGLLDTLDDEERAAVLAHEQSHLRHAHRTFATVATLAAAVNPILVPVRNDLAFALELWADEDAAVRTNPAIAARALTKAALARLASVRHNAAISAAVFHLGQVGVPQRVAALLRDAPARRRVEATWLVALVGTAAIASVVWATHDTERLFEALRSR